MASHVNPITGDFELTAGNDFAQPASAVADSMVRRLHTQRGSALWDLSFGSRLHELVKTQSDLERQAVAMAEEALRPMVDAEEIRRLSVRAERTGRNRLALLVRAEDGGQRPIRFTTFVRV